MREWIRRTWCRLFHKKVKHPLLTEQGGWDSFGLLWEWCPICRAANVVTQCGCSVCKEARKKATSAWRDPCENE